MATVLMDELVQTDYGEFDLVWAAVVVVGWRDLG